MNITKQKLQELYETNTNDDVCKILGISKPTLLRYIKSCNIPMKGKGGGFAGGDGNPKLKII